jgi:acetyltransferase-like isoleucine patch superfamily enzyme
VQIGRRSYVGGGGNVTAHVTVGNFTSIAGNVAMHARIQHPCIAHPAFVATGPGWFDPDYPPCDVQDRITIGSDVWIGRDAVLLGGVTIGDGAIVGAFAVVAKDIPPYAVAVGNPVVITRYRFDEATIAALLRIRWWDWPEAVIAERAADLRDVRTFVATYDALAPMSIS